MSDPFVAEIRIFAGNFAPRDWAFCNGALLPISQHTALFSIVGTFYGGDGRTTLGLPNLAGRAAMHWGNGPGLTPRQIGRTGGVETATLNSNQIPSHSHALRASTDPGEEPGAGGNSFARSVGATAYQTNTGAGSLVALDADALPNTGGSGAHNNMQPYLGINFIIALNGTYPPRS